MAQFVFQPADLAPGDGRCAEFDTSGVEIARVSSVEDPNFEEAYGPLWTQFGAANEVESREVLGRRLGWDAADRRDGLAMRYDLLLMRRAGEFMAVRDHTAIADASGAVVHLSHALVNPAWRRSGVAGWLRAFPIQTARECMAAAGWPAEAPITLAAEMEYLDGKEEARLIRLKAYERSGYRKVDPAVVAYFQPDFRAPVEIDAAGGPEPIPFQLILRRVGKEHETQVTGAEVRTIVERLYRMYAQEFRPQDMAELWNQLDAYPEPEALIDLIPPTA